MGSPDIPVVVYDACVLYPFSLRNVLVQLAVDRLVEARWTDDIHEEWIRSLVQRTDDALRAGLRAKLEAVRNKMQQVLPDANVTGYQHLLATLTLPDPDDRHVLAAAIRSGATSILTLDGHFTDAQLAGHGVAVERPGGFLLRLLQRDEELMLASLARARLNLRRSTPDPMEFVATLRRIGRLDGFCDALAPHLSAI